MLRTVSFHCILKHEVFLLRACIFMVFFEVVLFTLQKYWSVFGLDPLHGKKNSKKKSCVVWLTHREELWLAIPSRIVVLIPVANHLFVCCYLNKLTGVPCIPYFLCSGLCSSGTQKSEFLSLFLKSSWFVSCLISSGIPFHLSTLLNENENFLWSVLVNFGTRFFRIHWLDWIRINPDPIHCS